MMNKSDVEYFLDVYSTKDYEKAKLAFENFCSKYEYLITDKLILDKYKQMKLERDK